MTLYGFPLTEGNNLEPSIRGPQAIACPSGHLAGVVDFNSMPTTASHHLARHERLYLMIVTARCWECNLTFQITGWLPDAVYRGWNLATYKEKPGYFLPPVQSKRRGDWDRNRASL